MDDFTVDELLKEFGDLPTTTGNNNRPSGNSARTSSLATPPFIMKSQLDARIPVNDSKRTPATRPVALNDYSLSQQQPLTSTASINMQHQQTSAAATRPKLRSSLDDLLDDLEAVGPLSPSTERDSASGLQRAGHHHRFASTSSITASDGAGARSNFKCMGGMFLGGSAAARGRNGSVIGAVTCCDSIRCTKCDFKVVMFDNQAWHNDVDYLFFRNNYPTAGKLALKLATQAGATAYCCQCSWRTVQGPEASRIDSYAGDLRWVCAGHAGCGA